MAEAMQTAEAGMGTRTFPPKLLLCRPVGNDLSITGGMQVEAGQSFGRGYERDLKIDGKLGYMASKAKMWLRG